MINQVKDIGINPDELINIKELDKIMINLGKSTYSVPGHRAWYEGIYIESKNGKWEVFYTERGNKYNPRMFDNEGEACLYFFEKDFR